MLSGFFTVKLSFFPFRCWLSSLEGRHCMQPAHREWGVTLPALPVGHSIWIHYLEFLFMGDFSVLLHLCIYSIICLYQYAFTGIYFYTLGSNPILHYLCCCSEYSSFGHWEAHVSMTYLQRFSTFWHHTMPQAHVIYFLLLSEGRPFLQGAWFLLSESLVVLGIKIWALGVLIATGVLLLLSPIRWQGKENVYTVYGHIYKYTIICIYIKLNMS